MALFRLTFFYESNENGWSESIHTTSQDLAGLSGLALTYANLRMAFSHLETFMTHVRISDDLVFRDIILDPINLPRKGQFGKAASAEAPWTALDLRLQAGPTVTRSLFIRGLPDGQIDSNLPSFTPAFQTVYMQFVNNLLEGPFGIKNKDRTQVKQPINTISAGGVVNMTNPIAGLANLDTVQLLGIPRSKQPKRSFTVINFVDASNFTLRGWTGGAVNQQGFLRRVNYIISPIVFAATDFATTRHVGRPFGLQRGRRAVIR